MKNVVIVPTYNERENIVRLVPEIFKYLSDFDVLVVDDNSPDGTAGEVENLRKKFPRLSLLVRERKEGLGKAYADAFARVLSGENIGKIVTMDADFSHDPRHLPELFKAAGTQDAVIIGSRYVAGGGIEGWEWWRRALSRGGNFYFRLISRLPARDCTSGFMAIPASLLRKADFAKTDSLRLRVFNGVEVSALARRRQTAETPIVFRERKTGESKISGRIVLEGVMAPWKLLTRDGFHPGETGAAFRRLRVPAVLLLIALVFVSRF